MERCKFRSDSDLCLTGDLRQMLLDVIAYGIQFDLNLYREIKRAIADICFGGIDRMRTAIIRMLRRGEAAIISSLFRYVPGGHGLPRSRGKGLRRVGMPRPSGLSPHRSAHLRPDGSPVLVRLDGCPSAPIRPDTLHL